MTELLVPPTAEMRATMMQWFLDYAPVATLLLGAVLSAGGALLFQVRQTAGKRITVIRRLSSYAPKVVVVGALLSAFGGCILQTRQVTAAKERAVFESEMRLKTEASLRQTQESTAMITGGDSYCAALLSAPNRQGTIGALILHEGRYPCYDVSVTIEDFTARGAWVQSEKAKGRMPFPDPNNLADRFTKVIPVGNIGIGSQLVQLPSHTIPAGATSQTLSVTTSARNASVYAVHDYRLVGGKWLRHVITTLYKDGKAIRLKDDRDPGFPSEKK